MSLLFIVLIVFFSLFISFQDFKERRVSIWALVGFSILLVIEAFYLLPAKQVFSTIFLNVCFLLVQFALVFLYYYLRYRSAKKLMTSFGGADIWLLSSLVIAFSLPNFVVFITISLLLSLMIYLLYRMFSINSSKQIPLAGFVSVIYCASRLIMYFYSPSIQWNDEWVYGITAR